MAWLTCALLLLCLCLVFFGIGIEHHFYREHNNTAQTPPFDAMPQCLSGSLFNQYAYARGVGDGRPWVVEK